MICLLGVALWGCSQKASKVSQGLTPIVVNFYVVNQELAHARQAVKDDVPGQADTHLKAYGDVVTELRTMSAELAKDPELAKNPGLKAIIDSCLAADTSFLNLESAAIAAKSAEVRMDQQIHDINQKSRGNSMQASQYQRELKTLETQLRQQLATLAGLTPQLDRGAAQCRALLQHYNGVAAAGKLITYFNSETIFDLSAWEKPRAEHARPAARAKHRTAAKPRSTKRK
ncbi:MAG TPA: hypothetical protein VMF29_08745 [Candidatus Edwardsbacteria bacterium]|nr:hypothetical protein [Candidatus Edwardsbacteria bacterium]